MNTIIYIMPLCPGRLPKLNLRPFRGLKVILPLNKSI